MVRRLKIIALILLSLQVLWSGWHWGHKGVISSSGGIYFIKRVELPVPLLHQSDDSWRNETLGNTLNTLGNEGCALTSAAMVLNYYGFNTNPKVLNDFLRTHSGYTDRGWIYWEKAAEIVPNRLEKAYEDLPSFCLIDWNLLHGNPVIVRLKSTQGKTHFVVVVGKDGYDYLIADPGAGFLRGIYPLKEITAQIEALRFYKTISS
jgi:hypothetical protein